MSGPAGDSHAIEVHLPDGGHLILAIEDTATRLGGDCDLLIGTLLRADGTEHDIARALADAATALGLLCETSSHHPTVIAIRRS